MLYYIVLNYIIISSLLNITCIIILLTPTPTTHDPRPLVKLLVVSFCQHGFCETFVALFVVREVFSLLYFFSFVHDNNSTALVRFFQVNIIVFFNSFSAFCSSRDKFCSGFVICISVSCNLTSSR